jgi:hypothetical protein
MSDTRWMRRWVSSLWANDSFASTSTSVSLAALASTSCCLLLDALAALVAFALATFAALARLPTGSSFRLWHLGKGERGGGGGAILCRLACVL